MLRFNGGRRGFALVDDELDSARLLMRNFAVFGVEDCEWMGDARRAARLIEQRLRSAPGDLPRTLIVDLKDNRAAEAFVARFSPLLQAHCCTMVAMVGSARGTAALLAVGAGAVFERHDDLDAYGRIVQQIASLRVPEGRPPRKGT